MLSRYSDSLPAGRRGSNPGGSVIFRTRTDRPWGPLSLLYNGYRFSFPGVKRPGRDVNHSHPSSAKVQESRSIPLLLPLGEGGSRGIALYYYQKDKRVTALSIPHPYKSVTPYPLRFRLAACHPVFLQQIPACKNNLERSCDIFPHLYPSLVDNQTVCAKSPNSCDRSVSPLT
jgi:hypothetical protein